MLILSISGYAPTGRPLCTAAFQPVANSPKPVMGWQDSPNGVTECPAAESLALMLAALRIGHHFSISALCKAPSASGVCWSRGKISCRCLWVADVQLRRPKH